MSTMIAGEIRGYVTSPQDGHCFARSARTGTVSCPHRPQNRLVFAAPIILTAKDATATSSSGILPSSSRTPATTQPFRERYILGLFCRVAGCGANLSQVFDEARLRGAGLCIDLRVFPVMDSNALIGNQHPAYAGSRISAGAGNCGTSEVTAKTARWAGESGDTVRFVKRILTSGVSNICPCSR